MRGEVGLLTRNIVVEAEMQSTCPAVNENCLETENLDTFGGHIKVGIYNNRVLSMWKCYQDDKILKSI